jgi:hypothetical protein
MTQPIPSETIATVEETRTGTILRVNGVAANTWIGNSHNEQAHDIARQINASSQKRQPIIVHVEGGMVQDVNGIPPGYEVKVEDYDHADDTQPTWDAEKGCHVTVYGGDGV